ncbi:MAG: tRNA preQ1(34) S-adenosylmethionine ribosyltransferase-isomerase QueA [Candidatus Sumerlaeaceae bacterium]|jgi:S-adenosylmethionine:tRNA ribosyltransferase-isomerase
MKIDLFDYELPKELIAAVPAEQRDQARLMVLRRETSSIEHTIFAEIGRYLTAGDLLVINDSKVIPARMHGKRSSTGGAVEFLLVERVGSHEGRDRWIVICRPAKKLRPGETVYFANKRLEATIVRYVDVGEREVEFNCPDLLQRLGEVGEVPLPPYILQRRRELFRNKALVLPEDSERYQTVYAREPGSVAAPTAGLHFTSELLAHLENQGVRIARVTLHVGPGTFRPVEVNDIEEHRMHEEHYYVPPETAEAIRATRLQDGRVVAVGTTVVRTLESAVTQTGELRAGHGATQLMIVPGYRFKIVDALVTNFHLPRSTLLMLVCAFAGREFVLSAYREAVEKRYRFFSYGDAMLIL